MMLLSPFYTNCARGLAKTNSGYTQKFIRWRGRGPRAAPSKYAHGSSERLAVKKRRKPPLWCRVHGALNSAQLESISKVTSELVRQ